MGHDQQARADDALHPVRRLRRERISRTEPPSWGAVPPHAAPSPASSSDGERPTKQRSRLRLAIGLGLALAISAAWTAAGLHGRLPAVGTLVTGSTSRASTAIPAQAPGDAIGNLRMFSQTTGWAQRLDDAAVLHTTQGVLHWSIASPPTPEAIIAVSYVDAETAQALTVPADAQGQTTVQSWATSDGGATWSAEGSFAVLGFSPDLVGALDFVDPLHGWFSQLENGPGVTGTAVYRTLDGGTRWSEIAAVGLTGPTGAGQTGGTATGCVELTATFISTSTGWLTGTCSTGPPPFYVSHDGGLTWQEQPLAPIPGSLYGESSFPPRFTSTEDGTLLTEDVGAAPLSVGVFATTDGGQIWSLRHSSAGAPLGSDFIDANHGWLVIGSPNGDAAALDLYFTGDGGTTWSVLDAFPFIGMNLDFLNAGTGWASTALSQYSAGASYLLATDDGGHRWTALRPQISVQPPP